jgi:hypothetical protein
MKISKRMQLDLMWDEEVCWEALPIQTQQQVKELMIKLLRQAASREEVADHDTNE